MKTRAANGIENIAENILRSEESPINGDVSFAEDLPTGLPTSLATPKRRTRRHSLSTTDKRQSPSVSVSASSIRRTGTKRHHPEPQVEVRRYLLVPNERLSVLELTRVVACIQHPQEAARQ